MVSLLKTEHSYTGYVRIVRLCVCVLKHFYAELETEVSALCVCVCVCLCVTVCVTV
jgi:hypothetical protein